MTVTSRITAQAALPEHPDNGVERGFVDTQAIVLAAKRLDELAAGWRESRLLNVAVLRALLLLTRRAPERADSGFDALEVAEAVGTVIGRPWVVGADWDDAADKVRQHWLNLVSKTWPTKEEGVRQHFQQLGLDFVPELSREEGGGQGNRDPQRPGADRRRSGLSTAAAASEPEKHLISASRVTDMR